MLGFVALSPLLEAHFVQEGKNGEVSLFYISLFQRSRADMVPTLLETLSSNKAG